MSTAHTATPCKRVPFSEQYSNKNHSAAFKCDCCGVIQRRNLNFLGRKTLVCNGMKFAAEVVK